MQSLVGTDNNGGKKFSLGRFASAIVLFCGLMLVSFSVGMEYLNPSHPVDIKLYNEELKQVITISKMVSRPAWEALGTFLVMGIGGITLILFPVGKAADALKTFANGKKKK